MRIFDTVAFRKIIVCIVSIVHIVYPFFSLYVNNILQVCSCIDCIPDLVLHLIHQSCLIARCLDIHLSILLVNIMP